LDYIESIIGINIGIMRVFIEVLKAVLHNQEIINQLAELKLRLGEHDTQLNNIYDAIENLLDEKTEQKNWENRQRIGFKTKHKP
jgi:uncharacterized membrane protein